jgi:hypothetical protein
LGSASLAKPNVGNRSLYGTFCRVFAAPFGCKYIDRYVQEGVAVEAQMSATLERAASSAAADRVKPNKTGIRLLTTGFGEGFEFAFAVCVLLGALWLLASGYA